MTRLDLANHRSSLPHPDSGLRGPTVPAGPLFAEPGAAFNSTRTASRFFHESSKMDLQDEFCDLQDLREEVPRFSFRQQKVLFLLVCSTSRKAQTVSIISLWCLVEHEKSLFQSQ
jgi:hypothetical protein